LTGNPLKRGNFQLLEKESSNKPNAGNGCYHSVHTSVFSPVVSKNINIKKQHYKSSYVCILANFIKRMLGHSTKEKMWNL
jgi:hypothetical protein